MIKKNLLSKFEWRFSREHNHETNILQGFSSQCQLSQIIGLGKKWWLQSHSKSFSMKERRWEADPGVTRREGTGCVSGSLKRVPLRPDSSPQWSSFFVSLFSCFSLPLRVSPGLKELKRSSGRTPQGSSTSLRSSHYIVMSPIRAPRAGRQTRWCHRRSPAFRWAVASRAPSTLLETSWAGPELPVCIS